jgi:L-threonylcarbamoyladenylate synthase
MDIEPLGTQTNLSQIAHRLYAALRDLDVRQPDMIIARDFGDTGLALAVRDRLMRAASGRVVWVSQMP